MKQSLSYYLTMWIIKLKGLKKVFSQDPINVMKLRKADVHQPKGKFFKQRQLRTFNIADSFITEIDCHANSEKLLIFIPGGAFISGPSQHHWDTAKEIAKQTDYKIWMCDYPKAPEQQITQISANINAIYRVALTSYKPHEISFIGDSAGGTLIMSLMQRLIENQIKLPQKIILVSPVMDASMSNPEIEKMEVRDPMLSKIGVLSAKKMCAGANELKNVMISPIYSSFNNFPPTVLCLAENDITYPDQKLAVAKLMAANITLEIIEGKNMPHIWPLLPVMKEAKLALNEIIKILNR